MNKMEKDYSAEVEKLLPETKALASNGQLQQALEQCLILEKQTRSASDLESNTKILNHIIQLCFDAKDYKLLNEQIVLLSKKHGLLKTAVTKMVQTAMTFIDQIPNKDDMLELINTIRTVTEGKIYVEIERARVTRKLSKMKEDEGDIAQACDILQQLQVETFGSMERREKTDFILEQMRLCLLRKDYTRVQIISKKISQRFFEQKENNDLKLRFFEIMVQHALHETQYLNVCKYLQKIYEIKAIKEDDAKWKDVLQNIVVFAVLAPFDIEQHQIVNSIAKDPNLNKLPLHKNLLNNFITDELMRWTKIEEIYGETLKQAYGFNNPETAQSYWEALHKSVTEHNIRVISKCYSKITIQRLTELLDLSQDETESTIAELVVSGTVFAKINRPAGVVSFEKSKDANTQLNEWSGSVNSVLDLIAKTCHLIVKEEMVHNIKKTL